MTVPLSMFIAADDKDAMTTCSTNSFLIQKSPQDRDSSPPIRFVFDLGLPRQIEDYPPGLAELLHKNGTFEMLPDVVESLAQGDLGPEHIDYVVFSHTHLDHISTPSDFPNTQFIVGPHTFDLCKGNTKLVGSPHLFQDLLPEARTIELPTTGAHDQRVGRFTALPQHQLAISTWKAVGPFEKALNIFEDGSLYLVSLPGHVPGHLGILAKVSVDPLKYVFLVGDAAHHPGLVDGSEQIGEWYDQSCDQIICLHADKKAAQETHASLRQIQQDGLNGGKVEIILSHDKAWHWGAKNDQRFWPGKI